MFFRQWVLMAAFVVSGVLWADTAKLTQDTVAKTRFMAPLEVNTVEELESLLVDVESSYGSRQVDGPVVMVLHGSEISSFIKDNYARYQSVVQKSTELTEKGYVQIEICERWLDANNISQSRLQPFVKTVEFGPARIEELVSQQYSYF